jgi:hypothetical protein
MWRNSKLFIYGWLPVRLAVLPVGYLALAIFTACTFLMWLDPRDTKRVWRKNA